jgi:dihydrofolate reductase
MSTICHNTMSLDGFIAGPGDAMDWVFAQGKATSLADETLKRIGAIVAGRRRYDLAIERWNGVEGIYGGAYEGQVFVLTHRPPAESASPRISFVSDGIESAVATAQAAAAATRLPGRGRAADRSAVPGRQVAPTGRSQ